MISLYVIGFTIRKSKDLLPIKKSGVRAPAAASFPEPNQPGSKERDVAVDSRRMEQGRPRERSKAGTKAAMNGGTSAAAPRVPAHVRRG
ncbi:TPA: hypothetical protein QDB15_002923 [Burkholderia vietnamiensis]|uniref:hypothetical protein n=1 Tax=Burkholderia vietnamiensis TaxID=60552 RepID=UPI0012D8E7AE|nr:hypothetical protein [Burkholderia vietnamiensis]MBR8149091.1 hypothetical protein [Burkholderia vietnamiensis]MBR8214524.1 hypothetical protein [Burkholderia vietnamiensis]MCA8179121.1 hypothetical protein [Burkholderia vietnamiensis]MCA8209832.1 hypothetical protein [Burkholderia vietnamiensis]MDN8074953.1 hypothetical protein [Burkholderia vietnamiensis]